LGWSSRGSQRYLGAVWSTATTRHANWATTLRKTAVWFLTQVVAATVSQVPFSPKLWRPKSLAPFVAHRNLGRGGLWLPLC
jgi:hypothetical protein